MSEPTYPQYPAAPNPWSGSAPGHHAYGYPSPAAPAKSVSGLGIATQILLGVHLLASLILLFPAWHERALIHRIGADPTSVSLDEAQHADNTLNALGAVSAVLYAATGIVWIIWFYRARVNVEAWSPVFQRRGRGWAIGAWFCPVVNLWFPAKMARDILDDSERGPSDSTIVRPTRPLVVVWSIGFAAMIVSGFALRITSTSADHATTFSSVVAHYKTLANITLVEIVITIAVGIPAILLVGEITRAQTSRMQRERARAAATPWAG